ncbi:MAG: hypothetical protein M9884_13390 [Rhodocyclaceae bacterium]|nr:hypothetical protein [Rhodocyclaceae bacterium]
MIGSVPSETTAALVLKLTGATTDWVVPLMVKLAGRCFPGAGGPSGGGDEGGLGIFCRVEPFLFRDFAVEVRVAEVRGCASSISRLARPSAGLARSDLCADAPRRPLGGNAHR